MKTLLTLLKEFDGTKAATVDDLTRDFKEIARRVLYGGHFEIGDKTEIYPMDIEFYYFNENPGSPKELNDSRMYHKGKDLPYFPLFSFYPNESGVDVTFENEERHLRASFLIRAYRYKYFDPVIEGVESSPRHLWEDMFGYHSLAEGGLNVRWVDAPKFAAGEPVLRNRATFCDEKPWRFIKN